MAKKTVKFQTGDSPRVTKGEDGTLLLKAPQALNVPASTEKTLDLGVSANRALVVVGGPRQKTLSLQGGVQIVLPGEVVKISVANTTKGPVLVERGDVLAQVVVLDSSDVELE